MKDRTHTHSHTHMRYKDSHVVLWGRKLICQRPFRGSKNTWTGPVSGSTSGAVPLPALFIYLRVLCSVCCFCVAVVVLVVVHVSIHTTWSHTWLAPAEVRNIAARASWERVERKILPTNRYMSVCEHVCVRMFVSMCVCRGCKLCLARAALVLCLCLSLTLFDHIFQSTCEACCAFICIQFASNARRVRAPQRTQRTETREQRQENREPCAVYRVCSTTIANHMWNTIYSYCAQFKRRSHFKYAICAFSLSV